jgi:hypothetical protein
VVDIVGTVPLTTEILVNMSLTDPYLEGALSVVVRDHRRRDFAERERLQRYSELTIAYPGPIEYIKGPVEGVVPHIDIKWIEVSNLEDFFQQEGETIDALIVQAEIGTAWTLLHPEYTVVVFESNRLNIPAGFAVPKGQEEFARLLSHWLAAKKSTGEIQRAYDYWIMGQGAEKREPRWSVMKDVLKWTKD